MNKNWTTYLQHAGIKELNQLQKDTLAAFEKNNHLAIYAPTGSGKTLSFLLPLLSILEKPSNRSLVIAPTRELALQIDQVWKSLKTNISSTVCYGGHAVKIEVNNLQANPTLVIGTPGRLADHMRRGNLDIRNFSALVMDEFDKCLELGFKEEIQWIIDETAKRTFTFFTSATELEETPIEIDWKKFSTLNFITEDLQPDLSYSILAPQGNKLEQLSDFIAAAEHAPIIVFCNFREEVDDISSYLQEEGIAHASYHGGMEQFERERSLLKFTNGSAPVLICTDLGARGLDIPDVAYIIHYGFPQNEASHTHRNGRTARMQKSGCIIYFATDEEKLNESISEQLTNFTIKRKRYYAPKWTTLYFSAGKKDKINKVDLIGFLCQVGKLDKSQIGKLHVLDHSSFVAVEQKDIMQWIKFLNQQKIKSKKVRIGISK